MRIAHNTGQHTRGLVVHPLQKVLRETLERIHVHLPAVALGALRADLQPLVVVAHAPGHVAVTSNGLVLAWVGMEGRNRLQTIEILRVIRSTILTNRK